MCYYLSKLWYYGYIVHICIYLFFNRNDFQEGEDENDMDANEPAEHSTLINDEESEHTMLLGRGVNQQPYKGNRSILEPFFPFIPCVLS